MDCSKGFGFYKRDCRGRRRDIKVSFVLDDESVYRMSSIERDALSPEQALIEKEDDEQERGKGEQELKLLPGKILDRAGKKLKLRKWHYKGSLRYFYWGHRYQFFHYLLWMLRAYWRKNEIENWRLCEIFSVMLKGLPRWKAFKARDLEDLFHKHGQRLPKWQKGYRASFLLDIFLHESLTVGSILLVAAEEGRAPETIYRGIKKARSKMRSMGLLR